MTLLRLSDADTVGLVLADVAVSETLHGIKARDDIPSGHKMAVTAMRAGEAVVKYGQIIGQARRDIAPGEHVHVHNIEMTQSGSDSVASALRRVDPIKASFEGFVRADGQVGTRNYIGIVCSVNCSATVARRVADSFPVYRFDGTSVDGVVAITHTTGCGMAKNGEGPELLRRTLQGYLRHPNFGGVLALGLGCEVNQIDPLLTSAGLKPNDRLRTLTIQEAGGTLSAIDQASAIVDEMIDLASRDRRQSVSAKHLTLGLQCGGSDGWSGVTANPSLGRAADRLIAAGGTAILSETPEIYGAEQLLMARATSDRVRHDLQARLDWWDTYVAANGAELNNNPSPGNIEGGLTTILEKSLGAVAKSGTSPLRGVFGYAQPIDQSGFVFMDSPGYDPCSATGQMAAGANILAFTTGRGSVFGSKPAPCIKLASNARLATHMSEDMDVDCSPVLDGLSPDAMGDMIFRTLLDIASGQPSKSETLGLGDLEFVPWQMGAVM